MTYKRFISELQSIGADAPEHEAFEIIRSRFGKTREWCILNPDTDFPIETDGILELRRRGVPLQYIISEAWFYGYRFTVNENCLIPQPDTEHTVFHALKHLPKGGMLLDMCTGSGCIPIAILNEAPDATAVALEISDGAIDVAIQNAELHSVGDRLRILKADVLNDDITALISEADVITSNPPYINTEVIATLSEEVKHEPFIALDGGSDGMTFYRHFISELSRHMKPSAVMVFEIGYDQGDRIKALCDSRQLACTLRKDFGGNVRVAEIRKI